MSDVEIRRSRKFSCGIIESHFRATSGNFLRADSFDDAGSTNLVPPQFVQKLNIRPRRPVDSLYFGIA